MTAGYSGTPLAKKLGFKPGLRVAAVGAPANYAKLVGPLPAGVELGARVGKNTDIVQELNLPPVKIHCSVLAEDAIKAALADYQKKSETK